MKKAVLLATLAVILAATLVVAQTTPKLAKTYQVTGPITALTDEVITVQKGKDLWEIGRSKDAKVTGELKVGAKVTIEYRMTATSVEVKTEKAPAEKAPAKKK